jgi:CDP-paratose 2-epimerase
MRILITGGAGFIGSNAADHFLGQGHEVTIYDNLSRVGATANLDWLRERHDHSLRIVRGDVRDFRLLDESVYGKDAILHLASQTAVTTSVENPREDFEINALGTFNVLEAVRHRAPDAAVLYASSNKVYGGMESLRIKEGEDRYTYRDYPQGISEDFPLDFHSPYGCSKGAGDQYTIDYCRIYGLRTMVFRQSCIYGQRQFGVEDQGWVAHFIIGACFGRPITIFGNGKQVRDLLHVSDLVRAYELGLQNIDRLKGLAINVGGGPENTITIWTEFGPLLESIVGRPISVTFADWRPGDQRVFISDIQKANAELGWRPDVSPLVGIRDLYKWISQNQELFEGLAA